MLFFWYPPAVRCAAELVHYAIQRSSDPSEIINAQRQPAQRRAGRLPSARNEYGVRPNLMRRFGGAGYTSAGRGGRRGGGGRGAFAEFACIIRQERCELNENIPEAGVLFPERTKKFAFETGGCGSLAVVNKA
ncbi:hypothetical protein EVAR_93228_1 [Eumeta japonica]|uniref:Uncharacterized protein n=1 Tax=Eumeta variegata TaxID=151549 RepID=A0A4C1TXS9_EUMVA|nr:hypothetical protein EVAR_93228_1 [Eumeta japonica]